MCWPCLSESDLGSSKSVDSGKIELIGGVCWLQRRFETQPKLGKSDEKSGGKKTCFHGTMFSGH